MNCLTYAVGKLIREGGYLVMRRSQFADIMNITNKRNPLYWVPHFLHRSKDKIITQYVPTEEQLKEHKKLSLFKTWLGLWSFKGIVTGDDK